MRKITAFAWAIVSGLDSLSPVAAGGARIRISRTSGVIDVSVGGRALGSGTCQLADAPRRQF